MWTKDMNQKLKKIEPDDEFKRMLKFYLEQKLCVIPLIAGEKIPALDEWKTYQQRRPTKKEIEKWFYRGGIMNIAVLGGSVSGNLVILDFEDKKIAYKIFGKGITKETFCVESGSGKGLHIYWFTTAPVRKFKIPELALDVQGEGSYVAAPPSTHPSGGEYKVVRFTKIAQWKGLDFEEDLFERIQKKYKKFDPQSHRQTIDAFKLLEGTEEGQRNDALIKLATWYRRAGKTEEEATKELTTWNEKLDNPLKDVELRRTIKSAYDKTEPYKYWFTQNPEEFKDIEQYNKKEETEAEKLLNSQEILPKVEDALSEIVGERKTKTSVFLLELVDQSMQIGGQSSAGKNWLVDHVAEMYPKDRIWKITGTTDKALRYLKESVGTLYIVEWRGMGGKEEEATAVYDAKLIISEGELAITVVEKSKESGTWETHVHKNENVKNLITTSTDVDIPAELKTRIWYLTLDESPEQTKRITEWKAQQISLPPEQRTDKSRKRKIFRCAMKKLLSEKPENYVIPYMPLLIQIFDTHRVRVRRDAEKLELAIYAVAALHYRNRPIIDGTIVCLPQDFYFAWQYMDEAIMGTFTEKDKRFEERWQIAKAILNADKRLNSNTYAVAIDKTKRTARRWLDRFAQAGLLVGQSEGRGGQFYYYSIEREEKEFTSVTIKISDLAKATSDWMEKYGNSDTRTSDIAKSILKFSEKKIKFASRSVRLSEIIDSLPDAPERIETDSHFANGLWKGEKSEKD